MLFRETFSGCNMEVLRGDRETSYKIIAQNDGNLD
jgi:hypothetical protein